MNATIFAVNALRRSLVSLCSQFWAGKVSDMCAYFSEMNYGSPSLSNLHDSLVSTRIVLELTTVRRLLTGTSDTKVMGKAIERVTGNYVIGSHGISGARTKKECMKANAFPFYFTESSIVAAGAPFGAPITRANPLSLKGGYFGELPFRERNVANARTYRSEDRAKDNRRGYNCMRTDILALGHRFTPSSDLRWEALIKRSATMPLSYHSVGVR